MYACEHCTDRLGIAKAPVFVTLEDLLDHLAECHPAVRVQRARPTPTWPRTNRPWRCSPPRTDRLLAWVRSKAVPGLAGKDFREMLEKAKDLGLLHD